MSVKAVDSYSEIWKDKIIAYTYYLIVGSFIIFAKKMENKERMVNYQHLLQIICI